MPISNSFILHLDCKTLTTIKGVSAHGRLRASYVVALLEKKKRARNQLIRRILNHVLIAAGLVFFGSVLEDC